MPIREVYLTSGRSLKLKLGRYEVTVKKRFLAESYFSLSDADRAGGLEVGREADRPFSPSAGERQRVVWTLGTLFGSPVGRDLTFKGGMSLSKAYGIIDRFSEDLDLTYDIRKLIADLIAHRPRSGLLREPGLIK